MMKKIVCSVLNLFVIMLHSRLVSSQLPADQVSAMTSVYEIIRNNTGSSSVWSDVLRTSNPCSWRGVFCSSDNSSINNISFASFSISTSEFLSFLCNISTLESLDVSNNQLSSIPDGFFTGCGEISGLEVLNFSVNNLRGPLPTFNGFAMLENLDLSHNSLSGDISLQLDGLGSLKVLNLGGNQLIGKIPTNLGKMNLLEKFLLSSNNFTGGIPQEISKCKNLRVIDFSSNKLSGSIPRGFGELTMLQTLVLSSNSLSGEIPTSISNLTTLQRFAANQNMLSGTIPLGITTFLSFLDLSYNSLRGIIPSDLLSGANLQSLDLSFNKLEGPIPPITSAKLFRLRLGSNSLNGTISSQLLGNHSSLMYLELDNNRLSGELPLELGMLRKLALLNLAKNRLRGTLPPSLGNLTNLEFLNLGLNNFVGAIPPQVSQLNRLWKLNMNQNSMSGTISWVSNLSSLIELQLGSNQFSGPIPDLPITLKIALNLSYNLFSGDFPLSVTKLGGLLVLDLSNNRFSGKVLPEELKTLGSLTHLLLSNNKLSGSIPWYPDNVVVDISGNDNLIDPRDIRAENPTPSHQGKTKSIDTGFPVDEIFGLRILVIAYASGFPVGLLISMIAVFISRRYKRIHHHFSPPNSLLRSTIDFKKGMESVADPSNITLEARFSTFYKAVMPSGSAYLVKKTNYGHSIFKFPKHKELLEELEVFGSLSNSNVMIPVAYVLTVRRAYFFYAFVRGTLFDILHHGTGNILDWATRYTIVVGVAQGLAHLHECSSGPIILLDLCSRSILLKSLDEPLISDIELSKLIHPSKRRGRSMVTFAGSDGYVPPEYASTNRATAAGNVYSFGVVLLELLTGKPAVSGGTELAKSVFSISNQRNRWGQVLDSSISKTSVSVRKQMLAVLEVALACISTSPETRPNTITVLQMLLSRRLYN